MLNPMRRRSSFDNFDQNYIRTKRRIVYVTVIQFIISVAVIVAVIAVIVFFINNPEIIGEFFGKIVNGFNSTK